MGQHRVVRQTVRALPKKHFTCALHLIFLARILRVSYPDSHVFPPSKSPPRQRRYLPLERIRSISEHSNRAPLPPAYALPTAYWPSWNISKVRTPTVVAAEILSSTVDRLAGTLPWGWRRGWRKQVPCRRGRWQRDRGIHRQAQFLRDCFHLLVKVVHPSLHLLQIRDGGTIARLLTLVD
jgi:hypothetical protein